MGEEQGIYNAGREFTWCLDPLDGTGAFVAGLPVWGVSIGLLRAGQPYLGVIYLPLMDECYWADATGPAYWDAAPIQVSDARSFDTGDWIAGPSRAHRNYRISFPGKLRALGSMAAYFCYVARGSALGALLGRPHLWDIAAGMAILRAAGGLTVTLNGQALDASTLLTGQICPEPVVLATPALVDELLGYIEVRR
jgi:myo-inositol-1(or 4)-monophosphatase